MNINHAIRIIAGGFIVLSVALAALYNGVDLSRPTWLWFTLFVGVNLFQSGITRWCLMETILKKLGMKSESCGLNQ